MINTYKKNQVTGILLAAGMGTRFGGDKLLHVLNDDLAMGLRSALNLQKHVDEVLCVVRPNDHKLKQLYTDNGFTIIENPQHSQGLSSSIVAGIMASAQSEYWMLTLADMPFIKAHTYEQLNKLRHDQINVCNDKRCIIRPRIYKPLQTKQINPTFKAGHPVLFPQRFKHALLSLKGESGAKALFKSLSKTQPQQVTWLETTDTGIIKDVDSKQALPA